MRRILLAWLRTASPKELDEILMEVMRLKKEKQPAWDMEYFCWEKHDLKAKREVLTFAMKLLEKEENSTRYENTDSA